jgi:hypothetical protein
VADRERCLAERLDGTIDEWYRLLRKAVPEKRKTPPVCTRRGLLDPDLKLQSFC